MKLMIGMMGILMLVSVVGCGKDDKPNKAADPEVFKTQMKALEQAKQVEQVTLDAAQQQRQKIEEEAQ
jgi:hypothetical protein